MKEMDPVVAALVGVLGTLATALAVIATRTLKSNSRISIEQQRSMKETIDRNTEANLAIAKALVGLQATVADSAVVAKDAQQALREMSLQLLRKRT